MKKKSVLIILIIISLILLIPIPMRLKDGGSVKYQALLYSVTKYHKLDHTSESGYVNGIRIEVLGMKIYDRTDYIETKTEVTERTKISDLIILNSESINIKELAKFNGIVYGRSYGIIDYAGNLDTSIGTIDFLIDKEYFPELNGETNSENLINASVLEANEKSMVLNVNNEAVLFEAVVIDKDTIVIHDTKSNSFIGTVLEEEPSYLIVKPNEDEIESKFSDKIRINLGTPYRDYLYGVGRKVIINYNGFIQETYPAQITTDDIDCDGYDDFEILVKKSENLEKKKILNSKDIDKYNGDFDLYYYGLEEVNVKVDNKEMSLEKALKDGYVTLDGLISKANKDVAEVEESYNNLPIHANPPLMLPRSAMCQDGGSMIYWYYDYTIIKYHTLEGDRDVYIGVPEMDMEVKNK